MGKKSTKEDKSIYQICREEAGLTRAEASEAMSFVSESRIEKFESGKSPVQPEEVLAMAKAYKKPVRHSPIRGVPDRLLCILPDNA